MSLQTVNNNYGRSGGFQFVSEHEKAFVKALVGYFYDLKKTVQLEMTVMYV